MKISQIIHELRKAKGINAKMKVLEKHKNNKLFRKYLNYVYSPFINFNVKIPNYTHYTDRDIDEDFFLKLNMLHNRVVVGNAAREFLFSLSKEYGEPLRLAINKSLKANIATTTINKVIPDCIPTFDIMKAKNIAVKEFPCLASLKYDGIRLLAFSNSSGIVLRTSSGIELPFPELEDEIADMDFDGVLDGELIINEGATKDRPAITGMINRMLKRGKYSTEDISYRVFDCISIEDWSDRKSRTPYNRRIETIKYMTDYGGEIIKMAEQIKIKSQKELQALFYTTIEKGFEGLIVRYPEHFYEWTRTNTMIKQKVIDTALLTCTGIEKGKGKYEGQIGSLICEGVVEDTKIKVKVGVGLQDYHRGMPDNHFVGKNIYINYNSITETENGNSLFLPIFSKFYVKV